MIVTRCRRLNRQQSRRKVISCDSVDKRANRPTDESTSFAPWYIAQGYRHATKIRACQTLKVQAVNQALKQKHGYMPLVHRTSGKGLTVSPLEETTRRTRIFFSSRLSFIGTDLLNLAILISHKDTETRGSHFRRSNDDLTVWLRLI